MPRNQALFHIATGYETILRELRLDADTIFSHPDIRVWRSLPERDNATLDATSRDGRPLRLHIKRYRQNQSAHDEAAGISLLQNHGIPTVPLVCWGTLTDGRGFLVTEDLAGYLPIDKLITNGTPFDDLRNAIADLAARLHTAGLHHRDLYLCHIFARPASPQTDLRLIDAGRVRTLPRWPWRRRWIIKDLAQLWYSSLTIGTTDPQLRALLDRYAQNQNLSSIRSLCNAVQRKAKWIARHDRNLKKRQPTRNVSLSH
jgi:hypothetical protein